MELLYTEYITQRLVVFKVFKLKIGANTDYHIVKSYHSSEGLNTFNEHRHQISDNGLIIPDGEAHSASRDNKYLNHSAI